MGLKSHSARSFSPRSARKTGKSTGLEASGPFLPGQAPEGCLGVRSPGNGGAGTGGTDDSWPLRRRYGRGYRGTLTLPRGPGPGPTPPAGPANAAPMTALTAARAPRESWPPRSTPTSAAGARDFLQDQGSFHSDQDPRSATHPVNSACSGSPETSVTGCNDMRKMATCWTCGRTFWVWRLRERNFCSGKCRVRHHRSAFRKPGPSASGRTPAGTG